MSDQPRPQYYPNKLQPLQINPTTLLETLKQLRLDVRRGADLIQTGSPPKDQYDGLGMFSGDLGIAVAFLRLAHQTKSIAEADELALPDFRTFANQRIPPNGPDLPNQVGRLSPLPRGSSIPAVVARILAHTSAGGLGSGIPRSDIACLQDAVELALGHGPVVFYNGHDLGGDEVVFGRAGLLWAVLNIRTHLFDEETRQAFLPVFEAVPRLVDAIIAAGRQGSRDYMKKYGEKDALPLMWPWMEDHYGLGAAHGATGILSVLLACRLEELDDGTSRNYLPSIAATITGMSRICIANNGHLPITIPPRPFGRTSNLVQICHGSPGILLLLACARRDAHITFNHWQPEWDEAIRLATERVWEEGLLSKGGSLCHGIAGNAWPLLLLHDCFEYDKEQMERAKRNYRERTQAAAATETVDLLTGDYFLSRALALLLHARETQPFNPSPETATYDYRMPDSPYSLFEGLAGIVCAWAEACAAIEARLRKMQLDAEGATSAIALEDDEVFEQCMIRQLGFPGFGGHGPSGLL